MQFFLDLLYKLGIIICTWILSLVKIILDLIFDIANISFFSDDVIGSILTRVYIIVGVLMLFKITISCIQYLISPDKIEDKENGFGGIIKRALISIALLALVPAIFNFAKSAQNAILEALPKVILGQENNLNINEIGENIAYTTALSFFNYSSDACNDGSIGGIGGGSANSKFSNVDDILKEVDTIVSARCNGGKRYSFNFLCLPAAVFLVVILISMVVDVGVRVIKFGFLEMIAPIPIASYIDPKTSKKSFDSWVHNSVTVYADLFIRLGVIYLVLHLFMILLPSFFQVFTLNDGTKLTWGRSLLVNVAIIISLLLFAKNAPKFICDVLGIKADGGVADMFKRAGGLAGAGIGGLRTARSNFTAQRERWQGKGMGKTQSALRAALSAAAGATSATARGLKMAAWDKKGFNDVRKGASKAAVAARDARTDRVDNLYQKDENGKTIYGWRQYQRDKRRSELGIPSDPGFTKAVYDVMDSLAQSAGSEKSFGATKMNERPTDVTVSLNGVDYNIATARSFANIQVGTENVTKPDGTIGTWTVDDQARAMDVKEKVEKQTSYIMTATLINENDPTARMNHEKTILAMKNNQSMFNVEGVMDEITRVFRAKGVISGTEDMTYDKMIQFMENMPADAKDGAKIIDAVKTSFENIRTNQYAAAQAAEARAKKTQQAIQNDKKGS